MNELMITVLENDWLLYGACGAAALGCLIQIILSVIYNRSLNASERMRSTKIAWLRQMKTRYESGYEWNNRIRNVELFVDKNVGRRKWMGIYLKTWEELSKLMVWLVLLLAAVGAVCVGTYIEETTMPLFYLVTGAALALVLRGLTALANIKEKENMLRTNLCDYFENTLRGEAKNRRRENRIEREEYFGLQKQREEIACAIAGAQRQKEKEAGNTQTAIADAKRLSDRAEQVTECKAETAAENKAEQEAETAVGSRAEQMTDCKAAEDKPEQRKSDSIDAKLQQKQEEMKSKMYRKEAAEKAKVAAKSNKQVLRREKKQAKELAKQTKKEAKLLKKQAKKEAKAVKKQEKRAAKEAAKLQQKQQKEQKRVDKLTKRMERMQLRLGTAAASESVSLQNSMGGTKEESARMKREQLKKKVEVTPAQEDQIIADVLREFLA